MDKKTLKFRNIVLVFDRSVEIYTLKDTKKQQELFFSKFSELVPYLEKYDQSSLDRLLRRLKIILYDEQNSLRYRAVWCELRY